MALKHQCPVCYHEIVCDATKSNVVIYKPYKESLPPESEIMEAEDFRRMKESLAKKKG